MKDMSYLANTPIAVLGGGAVGKTLAADCKLAGQTVRLYSRSPKSLANLDRTGIQRIRSIRMGCARPFVVCSGSSTGRSAR